MVVGPVFVLIWVGVAVAGMILWSFTPVRMEPRATVWFGSSVRRSRAIARVDLSTPLIQAAGRAFHSREGPPFGLTGLLENMQRHTSTRSKRNLPRSSAYVSEYPNRTLPYGARCGRQRSASTSRSRHHLAVQVPSGVPEHGHDDDETKKCGY